MEDVSELEVEALAGQTRVPGLVVVKQSSKEDTGSETQRPASSDLQLTSTARSPDVERPLLAGPQGAGARADAAVHHLLPQVVDLGLKAAVL